MEEFYKLYTSFINNSNVEVDINALKPTIYNTANNAIFKATDIGQRIVILEKLITLYPEDHELYYKLGQLYKGISKEKELLWYKLCHSIKPDYKENFCDLCDLLLEFGFSNHIFSLNQNNLFEKFMKEPRFLTVYTRCNLINLKYENGLACLLDLIKLNSTKHCVTDYDKNEKWRNYHDAGYLFSAKCDVENAIKYSQKAADLSIKFNLELQKKLLSHQNVLCFSDYMYVDHDVLFKKYLGINELLPYRPLFTHKVGERKKRIRLGYVSSDFVMHSVSNFILPILKNHDRNVFEIFLFANSDKVDPTYSSLGASINFITNKTSKTVAEMIYSLKIDILFDLNGHTVNNKLEVFSYCPAPIQVTYLGYPNTTGLKSIQYRITDSIADSYVTKQKYSEELIRMPRCFLLYEPIHKFVVQPRETQDKIVLGAINKENKSNDELLCVWGKILELCPNTVIMIKLESFDNQVERTEFYMKKLNTTRERIVVLNKLVNGEYETVFSKFDLLLDPFPYSGTTTTCNALYNSVPVVTLYHPDHHVTNVSSSLLINSGFPELVANSKDQYIDIVVDLVNHPEKINEYKKTIRPNFLELMQPKPFMNSFEAELTHIYNKFHEGNNHKVTDTINLTFEKEIPSVSKKVYICGCVKNCADYLEKVFDNIDKIIPLFSDYTILIAYDGCIDTSLDILLRKKEKYNMRLFDITENKYINDSTMRTKCISNARNEIVRYIYSENDPDYSYFIMMDMDNVCTGNMDSTILKKYLIYDYDWDSLSFNRSNYFDIWALSIDHYVLSCWHFPGGFDIVNHIKRYITEKLACLRKDELLECTSAFNGFAIYKKDKFADCFYDWNIMNSYDMVPSELVDQNEKALGTSITLDTSYHEIVHPMTDCEHRYFHMSAIEKNDAKIRISPLCLFTD